MQIVDRNKVIGYTPQAYGEYAAQLNVDLVESSHTRDMYRLTIEQRYQSKPLYIKWKLPAKGIRGAWTTNSVLDKRFKTDWELPSLHSSISNDAPIISLFGHNDENIMTLACTDLVDYIPIEASLREEDNHFYFVIHLFTQHRVIGDYESAIIIDRSPDHFSHVVQRLSLWSVDSSNLSTRGSLPHLAQTPLYSTWYSFHQNLNEKRLLSECHLAKSLGYDLIIVDDGWQTRDDKRGYDYTGDWRNERFEDVASFVRNVHQMDMGIMFWYAAPFCGKKSDAYHRFKGKFLTELHPWAPVFDPRYPEVRRYLVDIYVNAVTAWQLDGFKLDFIDAFKVYPDTEQGLLEGRDTISVSEGVFLLIQDIAQTLLAINPDVLIEFRQQYISPVLQILGNMYRAFDCPNDSVMNRVRTTDVKLICGNSAVHSDMITWSPQEDIEVAALQFSSILFSVPQLSVPLDQRSDEELAMISFFTNYWRAHKSILMGGVFTAFKPLSNYPILSAIADDKAIIGIYDDVVIPLTVSHQSMDIINGKLSKSVFIDCRADLGSWAYKIKNCMGQLIQKDKIDLSHKLHKVECPANGIIFLEKL